MAKPRVFVSSTYYDLKYIRASLDLFVDSLGFEPVLSEKGDIAYAPDRPLDESCYREVENADIFVLIVGGRYGAEVSSGAREVQKTFFDRYESITKKEYGAAAERDIPVYILIEKGVYSEYQTFSRNKDIKNINYAHVDSVNVFVLIEEILSKPRNNPVHTFEKFEEIESWLREQWAGLFRELLRRQSQQQQLTGLSQQVVELKETNETLKKYLEAVMRGVGKQETDQLIESEERRLEEFRRYDELRRNDWITFVTQQFHLSFNSVVNLIRDSVGYDDFAKRAGEVANDPRTRERIISTIRTSEGARKDLNDARRTLELAPFMWLEDAPAERHTRKKATAKKVSAKRDAS
jgi:hypothetical protein